MATEEAVLPQKVMQKKIVSKLYNCQKLQTYIFGEVQVPAKIYNKNDDLGTVHDLVMFLFYNAWPCMLSRIKSDQMFMSTDIYEPCCIVLYRCPYVSVLNQSFSMQSCADPAIGFLYPDFFPVTQIVRWCHNQSYDYQFFLSFTNL